MLDLALAKIHASDFVAARTLLEEVRKLRQSDSFVTQQLALATYKSKQPTPVEALLQAARILDELKPQTTNNPETLGLWGAIHKHLWEECGDPACLRQSIAAYERGFCLKQDHYKGINLAYLLNLRAVESLKAGMHDEAVADSVLAKRVRQDVIAYATALIDQVEDRVERYWLIATLYEAAIGSGDSRAIQEWDDRANAMEVPKWMQDTRKEQGEKLIALLRAYRDLSGAG